MVGVAGAQEQSVCVVPLHFAYRTRGLVLILERFRLSTAVRRDLDGDSVVGIILAGPHLPEPPHHAPLCAARRAIPPVVPRFDNPRERPHQADFLIRRHDVELLLLLLVLLCRCGMETGPHVAAVILPRVRRTRTTSRHFGYETLVVVVMLGGRIWG